jgi:hypothetical protein
MTKPKSENYLGQSFEQWRFEIGRAINELGRQAYLDERGTVAMFNCNYDVEFAARSWLRELLKHAP